WGRHPAPPAPRTRAPRSPPIACRSWLPPAETRAAVARCWFHGGIVSVLRVDPGAAPAGAARGVPSVTLRVGARADDLHVVGDVGRVGTLAAVEPGRAVGDGARAGGRPAAV